MNWTELNVNERRSRSFFSISVNTEVTDISYLHQNNFFQKNLVKEHTEVPYLCVKSLTLITVAAVLSVWRN